MSAIYGFYRYTLDGAGTEKLPGGRMGSVGRILVVDDEPDLLFMMRRILTRAGHEITEADNGAAALASVQQSPPDLVVTDIMMPVMDGVALIRALRADPATAVIPILVVSGDSHLAVDADAALAKPCRHAELLEAAESLLQEGRGTP